MAIDIRDIRDFRDFRDLRDMDHIISYNVEHIIVISLPERSIGAIFLTHLRSRPAASLGIGLQETTC